MVPFIPSLKRSLCRSRPELEPSQYFAQGGMDVPLKGVGGSVIDGTTPAQLARRLRSLYCGAVGFEYDYIDRPLEKEWLTQRWSPLAVDRAQSQ